MLAYIFLPLLLLFQTPGGFPGGGFNRQQQQQQGDQQQTRQENPQARATPEREEPPIVTKHTSHVGSKVLNYTATTGFLPIKNAQTGETEAKLFYVAYTLDDAGPKRPLTVAFNGGPGSASVWLHMGAIGPKRVKMTDEGYMPPPPFEIEDNQNTWLESTDLVFVDPVGTGYSRASRPELASKFFGLRGDIESVGEFIRLYLTRNDRWTSPLFLAGESYGTTRASGLSDYLFEHGIALNGIVLMSTVMNFETLRFAENNDLPLELILPSYATTAWYHKKLAPELQSKSVEKVAQEARDFVAKEYAPAMLHIDNLTPQEKESLLTKFSQFTGLSKEFIERNNFRVELDGFSKELLRDKRRTTGRLDSRFLGIDRDAAGNRTDSDPSQNGIRPPYTAVFNDYVRRELGYKSDVEYYILGGGITAPWNYGTQNGYADTSMTLKDAMAKNPYMKIMIACGYYDMATPFYAAEYTISAMNLDPTLRKNISFQYYEAGHMMYIDKRSHQKLKEDVSSFIARSLSR